VAYRGLTSGLSRGIDIPAFFCFFALVLIGWISLFAAVYQGGGYEEVFSFHSEIGRQTAWLGLGLIAFVACLSIEWKFWSTFGYLVYGFAMFLLVAVLIVGTTIKGSTSWFNVFGFSFQPSEFAKLGTCLAMASLLASPQLNVRNTKHLLLALGVLALPAFLILLQPDAGSAIMFGSFLILLFRAGAEKLFYVLGIALATNIIASLMLGTKPVLMVTLLIMSIILFLSIGKSVKFLANAALLSLAVFVFNRFGFGNYVIAFLTLVLFGLGIYLIRENKAKILMFTAVSGLISILLCFGTDWAFNNILKPHQQDRINVWLRPHLCDPRGSLYNIIQSKTAIGSGGLAGSGFLNGAMTKLQFVPEQTTDFIFCTIGEEQGFLGVLGVIALFTLLLSRLILMAERTRLDFIRYYIYGVAGLLFVHVFINIGMTIGLMPVIGIPLPLMSKGGTSLLVFFILFGILFKMDLLRKR